MQRYDVKCHATRLTGKPAKPAITVFAATREAAIEEAVKELKIYGYANITVDHIVRIS